MHLTKSDFKKHKIQKIFSQNQSQSYIFGTFVCINGYVKVFWSEVLFIVRKLGIGAGHEDHDEYYGTYIFSSQMVNKASMPFTSVRVMLVKRKKKKCYVPQKWQIAVIMQQKNEVRESSIIFVQASYIHLYTDSADWLICTSDFH